MPRLTFFFPCRLLLLLLSAVGSLRAEVDRLLQAQTETVYIRWRQAFIQQDLATWLKYTSRYRQMHLRNQVVSQAQPWPRAVFSLALQPPELSKLKIIDARSAGETARISYYGRVDFGIPGESMPDNVLVLWFLKEGTEWKANHVQYVNLNDPQKKVAVSNGDVSFLREPDFDLSETYPDIPKPCEAPYHVGKLSVISFGCRTAVNLNGLNEEVVSQTASVRPVIGGLRKGPNKLTIRLEPMENTDPAKRRVEVSITIPSGNPARPQTELYSWKYDPAKPVLKVESSIFGPSKVVR